VLVEDDEHVRTLTRIILERHTYVVLDAQNAGEAFLMSEDPATSFDVLLTDIVLPRMSGRELAQRLILTRPSATAAWAAMQNASERHFALQP
jgi:CheY-like chemotaxis protein